MCRARLIPLSLVLAALSVQSLEAQWQLTADAGVSRLQQTGIPTGNASTAGLTFDVSSARAWLRSSALVARATDERWTGQGLIAATVVGPSARTPLLQFDATLSAFGQSNALPSTSGEVAGRIRGGGTAIGGAIGAGVGGTVQAGTSSNTLRWLADIWGAVGGERLFANGTLTDAPVLGFTPKSAPTPRVRYLDVLAGWRHDVGGLSLGAAAGVRNGLGDVNSGQWAAVDAATWATPRVAVAVGAGTALPDVMRGTPRARYVSASIRVSARPHAPFVFHHRSPRGPAVRLARGADGASRIEINAPRAERVELRGDFTDWSPVELTRVGDTWRLEMTVPSGLHRVAIRINGGEWIAPPNLPHADDGLGGTVGLITVP
ncbi:MAG TPA: glycogen-binding domain-containing protein [Gemmatimonadaceae bacterium]|nr:glycogen-binding domain-containing protein [Gemmatimonadaceae bacterium]